MKACQVIYTGTVQGVGFRYSVQQITAGYDVQGYVKNLPDRTVELFLQGEEDEIQGMLEAILKSHLKGFIKKSEVMSAELDTTLTGFKIRQ